MSYTLKKVDWSNPTTGSFYTSLSYRYKEYSDGNFINYIGICFGSYFDSVGGWELWNGIHILSRESHKELDFLIKKFSFDQKELVQQTFDNYVDRYLKLSLFL